MLQSPAMANLDAIVKELQRERDRLDAGIKALGSLGRNTLRARKGRTMSAAARRVDCCRAKSEMGEAKGRLESSN
jgi:hypothetical protein